MKNNLKIKLPTTIVIFGAGGDLSLRKLFPAFFSLYLKGVLPNNFSIVGVSRKGRSNDEFKLIISEAINLYFKGRFSKKSLSDFLEKVSYLSGLFEDKETYIKISENLADLDFKNKLCSNKLFYLAVPPSNYETILKKIHSSGLTIPCSDKKGWTRVLIEKPFGSDYKTAQRLDFLLGDLFNEKQIFRIDHYLAKETIQNILTFRFTNTLFEPVWNAKNIEKVEIKLYEKLDVSNRAAFYDGIGALRDVGQNHVLQILSAIAMDKPKSLSAEHIRKKREDVFLKLKKYTKKEVEKNILKARYKGYKDEKGVNKNSKTETYFKLNAFLENKRWKGIPFVLESGKALCESKTEVKIYFKEEQPCFCLKKHKDHKHQNILTFKIQPNESINIEFFIKRPGLKMDYLKQNLSFRYGSDFDLLDAYEKILFDCMVGDQTLFTSTKELLASWEFITSILKGWKDIEPKEYKKGSCGFNF